MNLIGFTDMVRDAIENTEQPVTSISEIEGQIRQSLQGLGAVWLSEWLTHCARDDSASALKCPQCGELSRYERDREASLQTMLGRVSYSGRCMLALGVGIVIIRWMMRWGCVPTG